MTTLPNNRYRINYKRNIMKEFTEEMLDEFCATYECGDISEFYYLFDGMLDECWGPVNLLGIEYSLSEVLCKVDTIHYYQSAQSYLDTYLTEIACGVYASNGDIDEFLSEWEDDEEQNDND